MDYSELIENLKNLETIAYGYNINGEVLGMDCSDFEQIMVDAADAIAELNQYKELGSLDRLRELAEADKEERVYILPCRIGDPIYIIHRYKDGGGFVSKRKVVGAHLKDEFYRKSIPRKEYLVTRFEDYSMHIPMDWIGKRAFFDKKSAEKALEEMEENDNG